MFYKIVVIGNGSGLLEKENGYKIDTFDYVVRMGNCPLRGYEKYVGTKTDMLRLNWNRIIHINQQSSANSLHERKKDYYKYTGHDSNFRDLLLIENDPDLYYERSHIASYNHLRKVFRRIPSWPTSLREKPHIHIPERILHDAILNFFIKIKNIQNVYYFDQNERVKIFQEFNFYANRSKIVVPSNGILTLCYVIKKFKDSEIYVTGFDNFRTPFYWRKDNIKNTIHNSGLEMIFYKKLLKHKLIYEL